MATTGRRVLVTGGTGSFGHTVTQRLLEREDIQEVRILSRDEAKQDQMRHDMGDERLRFYVGDIREYLSVERAMKDVDYVFHAAALKQVPSCEFFPMEAVRTNVSGSENVVRAADHAGVSSVVCLSTDKAVYPVNAMGMSKALMEKVATSFGLNNRGGSHHSLVCAVRERHVLTWLRDPPVHPSAQGWEEPHGDQSGDDPVHDDAGGFGLPGGVRLRERQPG